MQPQMNDKRFRRLERVPDTCSRVPGGYHGHTTMNLALITALTGLILAATGLPGHAEEAKISRVFSAEGIKVVVLRAGNADEVKLLRRPNPREITVSGLGAGGAKGFHSSDRNWKETPPKEWGLDFVARQFGDVLVISTFNEIRFMHHAYRLRELELSVPMGVEVKLQKRELSGDGKADLSRP
jgi:hypothetical protein